VGEGDQVREHQAGVIPPHSINFVRRTAAKTAAGTFLPCQPRRAMSVIRGRPAEICSMRVLRILTRSGHLATVRSPRGRHVEAECSSGWSRQWPVIAPETFVEPEPGGKLLGHSAVTLDRNLLSDHGLPTCVPKIDRN
jgi:hypothetical protein